MSGPQSSRNSRHHGQFHARFGSIEFRAFFDPLFFGIDADRGVAHRHLLHGNDDLHVGMLMGLPTPIRKMLV